MERLKQLNYVCFLALAVYLVIYVLGALGVALPPKVVQILWIIVMLVVLLMILRIVLPGISHGHVFGMIEGYPAIV